MAGWVGLVDWLIADASPTKWLYTASCRSSAGIGKARRQDRRSNHYATAPTSLPSLSSSLPRPLQFSSLPFLPLSHLSRSGPKTHDPHHDQKQGGPVLSIFPVAFNHFPPNQTDVQPAGSKWDDAVVETAECS